MEFRFSRRKMMQGVGGAALAQSLATAEAAPAPRKWPIEEGPDTPKICLSMGDGGGPLPASLQPRLQPRRGWSGRGGGRRGGPRRKGRRSGAATADFWRPKRKLRRRHPPMRLDRRRRPRLRQSRGQLSAHPATRRDSSAGRRHRGLALDRRERTPRRPDRQGCRTGGLQRDDQPPDQRHLRQRNPGQGHGAVPRIHRGRRQGRAAGGRVQLLRAPGHRGLLRNRRQGQGGLHGFRLRARTARQRERRRGAADLPGRKRTDHARDPGRVPERQEGEVQGPAAAGQ